MQKRILSLILAIMMMLTLTALASCGDDNHTDGPNLPVNDPDDGDKNTLTAPDGSTVELPKTVTKIITVSPAAESMFAALNLADKITAKYDTTTDNTSAIVSAAPEVVIYDEGAAIDASALTSAGIVAVKLPVADSMATVKQEMTFIGKMMGVSADSAVDSITKSMTALRNLSQSWVRLNVYVELGSGEDGFYTAAPGSYVYELVSSAGGNNIFSTDGEYSGFITVSADEIIAANPDIIFTVGSVDDITSRDGWSGVKAVADGQVYALENLTASPDAVTAAQFINARLSALLYGEPEEE